MYVLLSFLPSLSFLPYTSFLTSVHPSFHLSFYHSFHILLYALPYPSILPSIYPSKVIPSEQIKYKGNLPKLCIPYRVSHTPFPTGCHIHLSLLIGSHKNIKSKEAIFGMPYWAERRSLEFWATTESIQVLRWAKGAQCTFNVYGTDSWTKISFRSLRA